MYQALYRKYRPKTFDDVLGQKHITDTIKAQIVAGKLSHAYLFTGTRGTGKTSCAKILAKAVNCENNHDGNPCNQCSACRSIDAGGCVDVLEIDAASNNGVDHVRALRDEAVYSPSQVKMRVYIVDEVHMLSTSAFNALLKIIEEPPAHLLFILATTELHKVPATILSRCQRYAFRRLQVGDISTRINYVAYQEGIDITQDGILLLANLADGALRDGLSLLDQCASGCVGQITQDTICSVLGYAGQRKTAELLHAIAEEDANRALQEFSQLYAAGKDLSALVSELSTLARDLLIMRTAPQSGGSMLSGLSTEADRQALLQKLSPAQLLRIINVLQRTAAGFSLSADPRLDVEICLMELCNPALSLDLPAISARIGRLEEQVACGKFAAPAPRSVQQPAAEPQSQPQPQPRPVPPAQEEKPAPAPESRQLLPPDFWAEFIARVKPDLPPVMLSFLTLGGPVQPKLKGDVLYLEAETKFAYDIVGNQDTALYAEKASMLLGRPVTVKFSMKGAEKRQDDPMEELLKFGSSHNDIIKIN